jgi:hypothetical protein
MTSDVEALADRLRSALAGRNRVSERRMFGGVCFMLGDHMLCGAGKAGFMFRIGVTQEPQALRRPGARMMEFNGRRFRGFVWVDPARCQGRTLASWVAVAERYVSALPPKTKPRRPR